MWLYSRTKFSIPSSKKGTREVNSFKEKAFSYQIYLGVRGDEIQNAGNTINSDPIIVAICVSSRFFLLSIKFLIYPLLFLYFTSSQCIKK